MSHALPIDWYRVPLPPGRLAELNRRSDAQGLFQAGGHLLLLLATGAGCFWLAQERLWWWLPVAVYVHGIVASFAPNAVHELAHKTVFRTTWLNWLFVHVWSFLGWTNQRTVWASHQHHHTHTLHYPHDQDLVFPIRYTLRTFFSMAFINRWFHIWPFGMIVKQASGRMSSDWERATLADPVERAAAVRWARCIVVGHAAITAVSLYYGYWIIPLLTSFTPLYGGLLLFLLNNTQHVGLQAHATDFRLNCRTFYTNPLFEFLYWRMNYHIEHHMYAAVPCYRLAELHREIKHALPPTPNGVVATWAEIIAIQWRQEQEPGYEFDPPLPQARAAA